MTIRRRCRGARALVRCLAVAALLAAAGCADSGAGPGSGPGGAGGGGSGGVGGGASGDAAVQVTGGSGGGGIGGGGGGSVMSFFVTSTGSGPMGGDLGGLEGADAKCQQLAAAVGAGNKTWVAWLSVERGPAPGGAPVHAKDRVGPGPWHDAKGRLIAQSLADFLPGPELRPKGDPQAIANLVDEQGAPVSKSPLHHDVLTGTLATGLVAAGQTCGDWKSTTGTAQVGHSDNRGPFSWTESHLTMGCTMAGVAANGGNGRFYCFARR